MKANAVWCHVASLLQMNPACVWIQWTETNAHRIIKVSDNASSADCHDGLVKQLKFK